MSIGYLETVKKVGNWLSAILLGDTRELIARIDERTGHMQKDLDVMRQELGDVQNGLGDVRSRVVEMSTRLDVLWKDRFAIAHSPRQLNERGNTVLNESGIKEIIYEKKDVLAALVKEKRPTNPYDAEQAILAVVNDLQERNPEVTDRLKDGAFRVGADIPTLLFVGGIFLRDLIFADLGFSLVDLDKPKSS